MSYFYRIQNKVIKSDIELFFEKSSSNNTPFFTIKSSLKPFKIISGNNSPTYHGDSIFFSLEDIDFHIRKKNQIIYYSKNLDKRLLQKYLFGLPFGFLMYQKGYFVVHASSVEINNKGFIFIGPSSSGKSSIVASLINRGFNLLSDDLVIINNSSNIERFIQKIDLSNEIYQMNNFKNSFYEFNINDSRNRRSIIFNQSKQSKVCPIEKVYFLEWGDDIKIEKSKFIYNFKNIFVNSFRSMDKRDLTANKTDLYNISNLSNNINCYKFTRPKDMDLFIKSINLLINHIKN